MNKCFRTINIATKIEELSNIIRVRDSYDLGGEMSICD